MNEKRFLKVLSTQFGFLAKSTGESLISHHYTTFNIVKRMVCYIPSIKNNEKEKKILMIAALTHDLGKKSEKNQRVLRNPLTGKRIPHKLSLESFFNEFEHFSDELELDQSDIKNIFDTIVGHHSFSNTDLEQIELNNTGYFTRVLKTADWLASMDMITMPVVNDIKTLFEGCFDLTCFEFSRFPSPFTCFALEHINKAYEQNGWEVLLSLENGSIFIGKPGITLPQKHDMVKKLYKSYVKRSLELQNPNPRNFTKNMLSGLSVLHPYGYLKAHEEKIREMLSKKDEKPLIFFKYLKDVLDKNNAISENMRQAFPVLDILVSATGTRSVNDAKQKWEERSGKGSFENLNALIQDIFYSSTVGDFLPDDHRGTIQSNSNLSDLKDENLFQVLEHVGKKYDDIDLAFSRDREIMDFLSMLISMEEGDIDFRAAALNYFDKYKAYKTSTNPEKGVCERCGSPYSERMQPTLGFLKGTSSSFSQIKAKYGDRATCGFCSFDNMQLRKGMSDSKIPIYVKIKSKIPELIKNNNRLVDFVKDMSSELQYADLEDMKELSFMDDMPVPEDFDLYLIKSRSPKRKVKAMPIEGGLLIQIDALPSRNYSPKEYRAKLAPLYHLMNLTCFDTSIGTEEQVGLFGEKVTASISRYYFGIAVLILASFTKKKQGKYVFAENMLNNAPSAALMEVESKLSENKKIKEEVITIFFKCICNASLKITRMPKGGDYTMKDLLQHAARLADRDKGIPHFCVEPEKRGEFLNPRNITKHSSTAPISRSLDELLRSGSTEMAIARFMEKLAVKIGEDESEEQNTFFEFVKKLIEEFNELKKQNIADFIKTKNALMTAVYVFTRYKKLKEVIK